MRILIVTSDGVEQSLEAVPEVQAILPTTNPGGDLLRFDGTRSVPARDLYTNKGHEMVRLAVAELEEAGHSVTWMIYTAAFGLVKSSQKIPGHTFSFEEMSVEEAAELSEAMGYCSALELELVSNYDMAIVALPEASLRSLRGETIVGNVPTIILHQGSEIDSRAMVRVVELPAELAGQLRCLPANLHQVAAAWLLPKAPSRDLWALARTPEDLVEFIAESCPGARQIRQAEIARVPFSKMNPAEYNPRTITEGALMALKSSLEHFGMVALIVWNRRTGNIVGGHQRYHLLTEAGHVDAEVVVVDLDEQEEKGLNLTLNSPTVTGRFSDDLEGVLHDFTESAPEIVDELELGDLIEAPPEPGPAAPAPTVEMRSMSFKLTPDQHEVVSAAIQRLVDEDDGGPGNPRGRALAALCEDL